MGLSKRFPSAISGVGAAAIARNQTGAHRRAAASSDRGWPFAGARLARSGRLLETSLGRELAHGGVRRAAKQSQRPREASALAGPPRIRLSAKQRLDHTR